MVKRNGYGDDGLLGVIALIVVVLIVWMFCLAFTVDGKPATAGSPPVRIAPSTWEFGLYASTGEGDTFDADLQAFCRSHPDLEVRSVSPCNFKHAGIPENYVVVVDPPKPR